MAPLNQIKHMNMKNEIAILITEINVIDPDTKMPVNLQVYKDKGSGGMFAVDSSFIDTEQPVYNPFSGNETDINEGIENEFTCPACKSEDIEQYNDLDSGETIKRCRDCEHQF